MLQKVHAKDKEAITKKHTEEQTKKVQEEEQKQRAARELAIESFAQILGQLATLAAEGSSQQRALALGEIGIDTALAISALTAAAESNPANAVTLGGAGIAQFASGMVRILANISSAKKLLSSDKGKAAGGFTGDGFGAPDETGFKVSGYVHQDEWVAPKWMTESPQFADTINMLELARQGKSGYAGGGSVVETNEANIETSNTDASLLTNAINNLNSTLSAGIKSTTVIDQNNILDLMEGMDEINEIKNK
jgi:tubulin-specific chaperone A